MTTHQPPIRVLIADSSLVCREFLIAILQEVPDLQVVGAARSGPEAVRLTKRLQPDIIAMDMSLSQMDTITTTRQIMIESPRPIIILADDALKNGPTNHPTFHALQAGALSVITKPTFHTTPQVQDAFLSQLKLMAEIKVVRRWASSATHQSAAVPAIQPPRQSKIQLVAMAASTGGPGTLAAILGNLPADFPVPILIVQHVTPGFSLELAAWLDQKTPLQVRIGRHAEEPQPGEVLLAPDNYHMGINSLGLIFLSKTPPIHGQRPAADHLFSSVARVYGATAIGILLTGMGQDGAQGLQAMRHMGARTIVQNEATSTVFGMPAAAIKLGAAEQIYPPHQIVQALIKWT